MDDPVIQKLIKKYGDLTWNKKEINLFESLIESIISQQLSIKASDTIFSRFKNLFKAFPTPKEILKTSDEKLRSVGLSGSKAKYIKSLSEFIEKKDLVLENLKNLEDEEVITELTKVKGIGRWTAEMILIFTLRRPDIFSIGDLALRKAVSRLYSVDINDLAKIKKISLKWIPYRSTASRYLWKSLE